MVANQPVRSNPAFVSDAYVSALKRDSFGARY